MGQQQLDGLRLGRVGRIVNEPPVPGFAQSRAVELAGLVEPPGPRFPVEKVAAVVGDDDLLAEPVVAIRAAALAFPAPHADQGQQSQERVVQIGTQSKVRGVDDREIVEHRDIAAGGLLGPLSGGRDGAIRAAGDVPVCHDSSVMSR